MELNQAMQIVLSQATSTNPLVVEAAAEVKMFIDTCLGENPSPIDTVIVLGSEGVKGVHSNVPISVIEMNLDKRSYRKIPSITSPELVANVIKRANQKG